MCFTIARGVSGGELQHILMTDGVRDPGSDGGRGCGIRIEPDIPIEAEQHPPPSLAMRFMLSNPNREGMKFILATKQE